jgi:hypothetical protein
LNHIQGKSTVSKSFSTEASANGDKIISFFIARDVENRNRASNIINSLVYQLATLAPAARSKILAALRDDERVATCPLPDRVQKLLVTPLRELNSQQSRVVFVFDALDECNTADHQAMQQAMVLLLGGICALPDTAPVKLFITSRMDHWIQHIFTSALPTAVQNTRNLRLHELARAEVQHDIETYFEDVFDRIKREHPDGESLTNWPTAEDKIRLVAKTGVLFIFASTVSRFLSHHGLFPPDSLKAILEADVDGTTSDPYKDLDKLYLQVLASSLGEYSHAALIQRVIATVVLAAVPLTVETLTQVVGKDVRAVVRSLSSVLLVPPPSRAALEAVRAFHPSFHDFLTDGTRCTDTRFSVDVATEHGRLAVRCFQAMNKSLKKDVCEIGDPSRFNADVSDLKERISTHLPPVVHYACPYWHFHLLLASDPDPTLLELYASFCRKKLLCWIEAVSLLGTLRTAGNGLSSLVKSRPVRSEHPLAPTY